MKVKVIKMYDHIYYDQYGEYSDSKQTIQPATQDWEEVDEKTLKKLRESLSYANLKQGNDFKYVLIEYSEDSIDSVFKDAQDVINRIEAQKKEEEERKAAAKKKREETALKRKQNQLAKLKKELGET